jgi:flagellar motility protein MotE (MotC chaperone)
MTTYKSRNRRVRGGTMLLISFLLFGSALLRLGVQAGPAISKEMQQTTETAEPSETETNPNFAELDDLQPMLAAFQAREEKISAQEDRILDRMKALSIAEAALDKKLSELVLAEEKLRATLSLADGAAEGDLDQLTGVYEKMKPKTAAILFEQMDPKFAAGFLARMRPDAAANILAGLTPQAAYTISLIFAGRNVNVPKE